MSLRLNEFCPIHRSLSCCGRETLPKPRLVSLGVQRVEDPHHPRGYRELRSPAEMPKLLNRKVRNKLEYVRSATKSSPTTTTSFQTTGIRKEWNERGETIIRTIFKRRTGGVTEKKDQPEWMTDGRSRVFPQIDL
jgi:hypothetical protein